MSRRIKPRAPKRASVAMVAGQLGLDGEEWQPTRECRCWPPVPRGCGHCRDCDGCMDCNKCAGAGCACDCD